MARLGSLTGIRGKAGQDKVRGLLRTGARTFVSRVLGVDIEA